MKLNSNDTGTLEQLEKLLNSHPAIENVTRVGRDDGSYLKRDFKFEVRGTKYKINWFVNLMTLYIGEFEMHFDEARISSTVPRNFKNFLQFYYRGNWVADIPLEVRREDND